MVVSAAMVAEERKIDRQRAAALLQITARQLQRLVTDGHLTKYRYPNGRVCFSRRQVEALSRARRRPQPVQRIAS